MYGCTIWTLTKRTEKKLDGNYTQMSPVILNKSWKQHATKQQLYGHLSPISQTIQVRLWTPTYRLACAGRPARTYLHQLCTDTGCSLEDMPRAMFDRNEWREKVREIRAVCETWRWWWCNLTKILHLFNFLLVRTDSQ